MTKIFTPTKRLQSLYCIWTKTGNPRRPLDCIWIDLEMRSFQHLSLANNELIPAAADETNCAGSTCLRKKAPHTSVLKFGGRKDDPPGE
jgi:hypothetical protein